VPQTTIGLFDICRLKATLPEGITNFIQSQVTFNLLFSICMFVSLAAYCPLHKQISLLFDFSVLIFSAVIIFVDRGNIYNGEPEYVLVFKINVSENQKLSK
jgi:hypothetical protein